MSDTSGRRPRAVPGLPAEWLPRRLRAHSRLLDRLVRFGLVTLSSASITVGLPLVLHELGHVDQRIAVAIAFCIAFCINFYSLRRLVFDSPNSPARDLLAVATSSLLFRSIEYVAFLLAFTKLHLHYLPALLIVLAISTLAKFFWYQRLLR